MNDTQIAIVLNGRQVERFQWQVNALDAETFDHATLKHWRDTWEAELAFLRLHPDLKARFRRQYEKNRRLSNQAQADWLKKIALPWVDAWLDQRMALYEGASRHVERRERVGSVINAAKRFLGRR